VRSPEMSRCWSDSLHDAFSLAVQFIRPTIICVISIAHSTSGGLVAILMCSVHAGNDCDHASDEQAH
jgi:hypothetical protein